MAAIIGTSVESGASDAYRSFLPVGLWRKKAPEAMAGSSFLLGFRFFSTLFLFAVPLAKALALQTKKNYLLYVLAIVAGGAMTHSCSANPRTLTRCRRTGGRLGKNDRGRPDRRFIWHGRSLCRAMVQW